MSSENPLLRKLAHLFPLTPGEQRLIETLCAQTKTFTRNEDVVVHGDRPQDCNLLLEGLVCRNKVNLDGNRQIVSFEFPGDIFDAQNFLLETMDHTVTALTPTKVAIIPHSKIARITEDYSRITQAIWKNTLVDASVFREWLLNVGQRPAYQRLAHLICEFYIRYDIVGLTNGWAIPWPITQRDVGDAIGTSDIHANRVFMELRGNNLIGLEDKQLVIYDWTALRLAGDFSYDYLHLKKIRSELGPPVLLVETA